MKILDFFFPQNVKCVFCNDEDYKYGICDNCYQKLPFIKGDVCSKCGGRLTGDETVCLECKSSEHYFERNYSILDYDNLMQANLVAFKQNQKRNIGDAFSHIVNEFFEQLDISIDIVIPVPIHENRLKERGFNQSEILVNKIEEYHRLVDKTILVREKDTPHQTGLSRVHRQENLLDAFKVVDKKKVKNKSILLVDDIFTTGSTIDECARMLYRAGAKVVYGLCLARGIVNADKVLDK